MTTYFVLHTLAIDTITYLIALKEGIQHSVKEMIGVATLGELCSVMYVQEHKFYINISMQDLILVNRKFDALKSLMLM